MATRARGDVLRIPVIAEEAVVTKTVVETGRVRVHKQVVREPVTLDAEVAREEVLLERVPIDRPVDGPIPVRTEGDVTIVSVVEEIAVVEKRFVLREEIRLTKRRTTRREPVQSEVRRDVVTVERIDPPPAGPGEKQ
jgi:uncharacterized protein (TIGR02271 family)